jgi:membrane protein involved in colicin uptake
MQALLSTGDAGVLSKLGMQDSTEARAAPQKHRAEALAKLRAAQEAKDKAEKELADAIAAAEAAQRAKDEAAAAAAAALAAAQREQAAQAKLQQMGVCVAGFQWLKVGGSYRCAGGSHFVSNSELGL